MFVAWEVPEGYAPEALESMERFGGGGAFSDHAAQISSSASPGRPYAEEAEILGAVNCVVREAGAGGETKLIGHNTDGYGIIASLREDAGFNS